MKLIRKISAVLFALCLVVPCFTMVASAADGRISFTDFPEAKVGDMLEVKCAVRSTSGAMGNIEVNLSYDSEYLRFDSAEGVQVNEDGNLVCTASGGSEEQVFLLNFQALKEGSTQISISGATIASGDGAEFTFDQGSSAITIGEGDPSLIKEPEDEPDGGEPAATDVQVEVNGETYTLTDNFPEGDIPAGYQRTQVELDGQQRQMVQNETSGVTLGYLIDSSEAGAFFLYNDEDATFSPYAEINISDTTSIVLLSTSEVELPEEYEQAELTLNGKTFPVWQNPQYDEFYVLYAINGNGENEYYRYDTIENTYQRFEPEESEEAENTNTGFLKKVQDFIEKYIQIIVLVAGLGGIIVLLLIIILAVKLHNRNVELDELYEEYGIDDDYDDEPKPAKEKKAKKAGKSIAKHDDFDDDFEDGFVTEEINLGDDFDEDEFSDEEDDFATEELSVEEEFPTEDLSAADDDDFAPADLDFDDEEDDEDFEEDFLDEVDDDEFVVYGGQSRTEELTIDDLDELLSEEPKKVGHSEPDDTFKVDFIDLD